jgi:hypothetical protein
MRNLPGKVKICKRVRSRTELHSRNLGAVHLRLCCEGIKWQRKASELNVRQSNCSPRQSEDPLRRSVGVDWGLLRLLLLGGGSGKRPGRRVSGREFGTVNITLLLTSLVRFL